MRCVSSGAFHPVPRPDAGTGFTGFVKDLIENQTTATATPVEVENRERVDSEPADAFPETFFR